MAQDGENLPARRHGLRPCTVDANELAKLAMVGCTLSEVAGFFGLPSVTELEHMLSQEPWQSAWQRGRATGRISVRHAQYQAALAGNARMLIWLGKQYLRQSNRGPRPEALRDESASDADELAPAPRPQAASKVIALRTPERQHLPARRRGPKPRWIDPDELAKLVSFGCTLSEVASFFGFPSVTSIKTRIRQEPWLSAYRHAKAERNIALRVAQWQVAAAGNVTMVIWLSKQVLGQTNNGPRPEASRDALGRVR